MLGMDGADRRDRGVARAAAPVAALAALLLAAPAAAQVPGWTFALSPYGWLPSLSAATETSRGTVNTDLSMGDALSDLNFAFMGAAEARKGRWSLIGDVVYSDISTSAKTPLGRLWESAEVDSRLTAATVYAGYRLVDDPKGFVDILGGARFYWLDLDLSLQPGRLRGRSDSFSESWADPVLGARGRFRFNDRWFATGIADIGGFGGGSDSSWQAYGSVGYDFGPRWAVQAGWRYMSIDKEVDGRDLGIDLSGPLLGLTFRF